MKSSPIKIPQALIDDLEIIINLNPELGYNNVTSFCLDAIRKFVLELKSNPTIKYEKTANKKEFVVSRKKAKNIRQMIAEFSDNHFEKGSEEFETLGELINYFMKYCSKQDLKLFQILDEFDYPTKRNRFLEMTIDSITLKSPRSRSDFILILRSSYQNNYKFRIIPLNQRKKINEIITKEGMNENSYTKIKTIIQSIS